MAEPVGGKQGGKQCRKDGDFWMFALAPSGHDHHYSATAGCCADRPQGIAMIAATTAAEIVRVLMRSDR